MNLTIPHRGDGDKGHVDTFPEGPAFQEHVSTCTEGNEKKNEKQRKDESFQTVTLRPVLPLHDIIDRVENTSEDFMDRSVSRTCGYYSCLFTDSRVHRGRGSAPNRGSPITGAREDYGTGSSPSTSTSSCMMKLNVSSTGSASSNPGRVSGTRNPNRGHLFFKILYDAGKLAGLITQNIDGLHERSGVPEEKDCPSSRHHPGDSLSYLRPNYPGRTADEDPQSGKDRRAAMNAAAS